MVHTILYVLPTSQLNLKYETYSVSIYVTWKYKPNP